MDPAQFLSALAAIIVIDIVLAGDNAIVIALAARGLPDHLRKRAIVWGAVGAIAVRSVMTMLVVWLLRIPGLLFVGGALLVWIAYRLLRPEDQGDGDAHGPAATTFWGAMRTIVVADAVMGLDNVLAVAGAAHGSYLLVAVGLAVSVPIVVWGSTIVLRFIERYPVLVYVGAGVLLWTAARMMSREPLIAEHVAQRPGIALLFDLVIPLVLWAGFVKNHRRLESRIHARLAEMRAQRPRGASTAAADAGGAIEQGVSMLKVLVPVDGSANALRAVRHAIAEYRRHHELELHLLNVQPRLYRHIARFVSRDDREAWQADQARQAMNAARVLLDDAGVPHTTHWSTGERAAQICTIARELRVHHIVMGSARRSSITRMFEDSVTERVLACTTVPVEVITGDAISRWERWGLPAGVLGLGGLIWLALD